MVNVWFLSRLQHLILFPIPQPVALLTLPGMELNASAILVSTLSTEAVPSVRSIANGENGRESVLADKDIK